MVLLWLRKNIISTFVEIIFWLPPLDEFANSVTSYDRGRMMILKGVFSELGIEVVDIDSL